MWISQTAHKLYMRCPAAYYFRYVKEISLPPPAAVFLGGTVHFSLAHLGRKKRDTMQLLPLMDLLDHFSTAFDNREAYLKEEDEIAKNLPEVDWGIETPGQVKDEGIALLTTYYHRRAPMIQPIEVEFSFERAIPGTEDIFRGRIDRIDVGYITDYKTGKRRLNQREVEVDIQPTAYAFGLAGDRSDTQIHMRYEQLIRTQIPSLGEITTSRGQADILWYLEILRQDLKAIKAGFFPCRPSWMCHEWCGYSQLCGFTRRQFLV